MPLYGQNLNLQLVGWQLQLLDIFEHVSLLSPKTHLKYSPFT